MDRIPNSLVGRDSGEWEVWGMEGIPREDLECWRRGEPIRERKGTRGMTSAGLVSILAAQKCSNANAALHNAGGEIIVNVIPIDTNASNLEREIKGEDSVMNEPPNDFSGDNNTNTAPKRNPLVALGKVVKREKNLFAD